MNVERNLALDDEQARKDALDVARSFIVQAPAGSGKTELLIQRYLCLLATVDNPEEVLAITFTRKAAAEMRLRVVLALQRAARGETPDAAHEKVTARAAKSVLARDREAGWDLIDNPRRMRVQTLDSLNASIARMRPLTAGATTGAATVDMAEMSALYRNAAAATLDWIGDDGGAGSATEEVLLHVDNNTGIYIDYVSRMLITRDQWLPFVSTGLLSDDESNQLRQRFEAGLERIVAAHLESLHAAAPGAAVSEIVEMAHYAAANLREEGHADSLICQLDGLRNFPAAGAPETWLALAEFLLKKDGDVRQQIDKRIGFPRHDKAMKQRMSHVLESLETESHFVKLLSATRDLPPVQYTNEQWSVLLSLFRLLPIAVAELQRLSSARGVTDYTEIALSAATALGTAEQPGDVALLLDYQLRHILIDEMQDTSKAQYRMLEALTGGWQADDGRTLFCVGDPMQSIYRFRNAEVAQFLLAKDNGIGSMPLETLTLRRNFRSGENLVHWFNTVFPVVMSDVDDPMNGAVSYSEAVAAEHLAGQGEFHLYPVLGSDKQLEAQQSFSVIQKTLAEHPNDTMAVLVRGRGQLPALLLRLRDAGISYQAVDIDRLTDLPEIIDALALTRAFVHLGDRVAWLGLLRSPWIGLSWTDVHSLVLGARRETVWELLMNAERIAALSSAGQKAVRGFVEVLRPFMASDRSVPLHLRVEEAWFRLGGPGVIKDANSVANFYRYLEILRSLEIGGTLADVVELQEQLDDEHVSTVGSARLQIMTMHKSKGLQFDHVLLHGLGRHPRTSSPSVMSWFDLPDPHGGEQKIISPVGRRDELARDPVHRFIERTRAAKDAHEKGRLLYVACTRARKSLHLVGNVEISKDGESVRKPNSNTLLSLLWPAVEPTYLTAFESYVSPAAGPAESIWLQPTLRRFDAPWSLPDLAPVPGQEHAPGDEVGSVYKVDYHWVGAEARLAGTIVHRWLQRATDAKVQLRLDALDELRPISRRWLRELGAAPDTLDAIWERIETALHGVLGDEKGCWLVHGDGAAELPLSGAVNGKVHSIVIDRVRIDDAGTHWIVDYKTSTHEGGQLQEFLQSECDRYREQLQKYAKIYGAFAGVSPRCALYFPMLREWVEIDV